MNNNFAKVYLNIFLTAFLFSTMEVTLKICAATLDPFQISFLRFLIGGIIMLPFAITDLKRNNIKITVTDFAYLGLLGIICIPISMLCFQLAILRLNASTAAAIMCSTFVFTMIFAHLFGGEPMNKKKVVVLAFGLAGIFFMIRPWDIQEGNTVIGSVLMITAAATFGLYTVMSKKSIPKVGTMAQTSISFIIGALVLIAICVPTLGTPVFAGVAENFWILMYISVFVTGLGYLAYVTAIKYSDVTTASIVFFIKPTLAAIIAVVILYETILWNTAVGILFITVASFLNIRRGLKKSE